MEFINYKYRIVHKILLKISKGYKRRYKAYKALQNFKTEIIEDVNYTDTIAQGQLELSKKPYRFEIINFLLEQFNSDTTYLEIGVRNPEDNFNKINSKIKFSVDPGFENTKNPVDFKMTSDTFFEALSSNTILSKEMKFDVIFIDGLHLANQVERDISNSLQFISDNGLIVLHDCNPPTEFHARELYYYLNSPAGGFWNGTTWKAFFKYRQRQDLFSCCIDSDWGVGIISKTRTIGNATKLKNEYYEYHVFKDARKESLNLISFEEFKQNYTR